MRRRFAAVAAVAVFLVLAGTGVGYAYWSSTAVATGTVKSASLANTCANPVKLTNGGFESPNISPSNLKNLGVTELTGWSIINDNTTEVWRGYNDTAMPVHPLPAAEGAQFVELNGNGPGTMYQDLATTPGQLLHWSVKHHGRWGTDTMKVSINAPGAALVQQQQFSTSNADWKTYEGTYLVPAGQTTTRFSMTAVSTATGDNTVGNLVDDATFGSGPCMTSTAAITNVTTGGTTYKVGDVVEYTTTVANSGGNHANSSVFTASVPAGLTYVAGSITIDGVAKTDASGDDTANISGTTITARLGQEASASAGGAIPPANSTVVKFRATVQSSAAGGSLSYSSSTAYVDALAPLWPLAAVSPTVTTAVDAAADLAVTRQTEPVIGPGKQNQSVSWVMRVTNNGPNAATNVQVNMSVPRGNASGNAPYLQSRSFSATGGMTCNPQAPTNTNTTTSLCTVTSLAAGASIDITFTGTPTVSSAPNAAYEVIATASAATADPVSGNNSATSTVTWDATVPTAPSNFVATRNSSAQIDLSWTASTDANGIASYRVYRNGALVKTVSGTDTSYSDPGLTANQPYWYWVVAVDNAGNASAQSNGEGAVTYKESTSYRVQYVNNSTYCVVATSNADAAQIQLQNCTSASGALRQWYFTTYSGDTVYVRFATVPDRRWYTTNDNTTGQGLATSTVGLATDRTRWVLGVYWDNTNAHIRISRATSTGVCLQGANTGVNNSQPALAACSNSARQQWTLLEP